MSRPLLAATLAALLLLAGCGAGASSSTPGEPFVATYPPAPDGGDPPAGEVPPPEPPRTPVFVEDAYVHGRGVLYGAFPSDVVRYGDTIFTTDGDQIDANGALVVPLDVSGPFPRDSARFQPVPLFARDLLDSAGQPGDASNPIGFGFFLNDLELVTDHLAFALVNAGGSDTAPLLSNLVAFDPTDGNLIQVVDLANPFPTPMGQTDSAGGPVPQGGFRQSGAEAVEYVATGLTHGRLHVAMSNLIFLPPSSGTVKYPATVQVFAVTPGAATPVVPIATPGLVTETLEVGGFNPVAVQALGPNTGLPFVRAARVLVTVAGTTAYDASLNLVPVTPARVAAYEGDTGVALGRFELGLVGLSGTRPAIGRDAAGHRVGFYPSAVSGEVYLLRLDGLDDSPVDPSRCAVLRGPANGIPITPELSGGPGGNIASVGLAPDGRTLVVASFGDLFAWPEPEPGRLHLCALPDDVVTGAGFGVDFVPGVTVYGTVSGRALGPLALLPNEGSRPDVYVAVSSPIDPATFLATGPASLGTLQTFGLIR